ncbi:hypothetical protein BH10BDE1_BH10BDE1_34360 [soil metagenome]
MAETRAELFELYPDMIGIVCPDGYLLELNSRWETTLGWSGSDLAAQPLFELIHREDRARFQQKISQLMSNATKRSFIDCRVRHRDGSYRFFFFSISRNPSASSLLISARDKTEYQRQADELATSKQQLEAVFSSMHDGILVQSPTLEVLQFNPRALEIIGVTAAQILAKRPTEVTWRTLDAEGRPLQAENHPVTLAFKTNQPQTDRLVGFSRSSGDICWVRMSAVPVCKTDSQKPFQVVITFSDVTEERQTRQQLETKEHELSRLMNTMPALIAYWDVDQKLVFANDRYCAVWNRKSADVVGLIMSQILGTELHEKAQPYIDKALQGIALNFEVDVPFADGKVRSLVVSYLPDLRDGKIVGFFSVSTDVSQLKELENERRDYEVKFVAASKMSSLGEMAAGIAHEINNPLAIISGKTSLLQIRIERGGFEPTKFLEDLNAINNTVERIAKTVRGLLSFARQNTADEAQSTCLQKIVETTLDLCREKLRSHGVDLRLDLGDDVDVSVQDHQISQILLNLLNNANDAIFAVENRWISIKVEVLAECARIRISDSGPKISDAIAGRLMNPFFTAKEIGKGTGLGLSISKGLAEINGGTLTFDRAAANTTFVLELPIAGRTVVIERKVS